MTRVKGWGLVLILSGMTTSLHADGLGDAYKAFEKGQYEEAAKGFQSHAKNQPQDYDQLYNTGVALFQKGNYDEASQYFDRAKQSPDPQLKSRAAYNKGVAQAQMQRWEQAQAEFQEALSYDNNNVMIQDNLKVAEEKKKQQKAQQKNASGDPGSSQPNDANPMQAQNPSGSAADPKNLGQQNQQSAQNDGPSLQKAPTGDQAMKDPTGDGAMKDPTGDGAMKDPTGDGAMKDPTGGQVMKDSNGDKMAKDPAGDKVAKDPNGDKMVKDPNGDKAVKDGPSLRNAQAGDPAQAELKNGAIPNDLKNQKMNQKEGALAADPKRDKALQEQKEIMAQQPSGTPGQPMLSDAATQPADGKDGKGAGGQHVLTVKDLKKQEAEKILRSVDDRIGSYTLTPEQANTEGKSRNGKDW